MKTMSVDESLFVFMAFFIQIVLIIYFAFRKWHFDTAMRYGWIVYALGILTVISSIVLLLRGNPWYFWIAGFLYGVWAVYGYIVDIARPVQWRSPIYWPVFGPYVLLYLSSLMFYWFTLPRNQKPLWYVYAVLFVISTVLNVTSH